MEISYKTEIPSGNDFFQLYKTTGWDEKYPKTKENLFDAITNRWYSISAMVLKNVPMMPPVCNMKLKLNRQKYMNNNFDHGK
jgi:hypothetical protein